MLAECNSCHARFDATGKRPGAVFRCPRCQTGQVTVPAAAIDSGSAPTAPPSPGPTASATPAPAERAAPKRAGSRRTTTGGDQPRDRGRTARPARGGAGAGSAKPPLGLIAAAAAVLVIAGGAYFALRDKAGDSTPGGSATNQPASTATTPSPAQSPREVYAARVAALADGDAAGRAELAAFCDEQKMTGEARALRREALLIDPNNTAARTALGFRSYDGSLTHLQGRWLDAEDRKRAAIDEQFASGSDLRASATSADVFRRAADDRKRAMLEEFPEDKWLYAYGGELMPIPFFVVIQRKDGKEDSYRAEYAETLSTLYEAFYQRYQQRFGLEQIERPIRVVMFDSRNSYSSHRSNHPERNYADPAFIGGYYQPWEQQLITWRQDGWRQVLFHEGTHMFVHYAFSGDGFEPSNQSPWFQEGFAEYFGGYKVENEEIDGKTVRRYKLGYFLPWRYGSFRDLQQNNLLLSVADLVRVDQFRFDEAKKKQPEPEATAIVANIYAAGWAFIMYLNYAHAGANQKVFDAYFEAEVNGAGHWESLGELLGLKTADDWQKLNEDFVEWANEELPKINKLERQG